MKALLCTRYGTPDDLTLADISDPVAGAGESWCASRRPRSTSSTHLIIAGKYQFKPTLPFSPAAEFSGWLKSSALE